MTKSVDEKTGELARRLRAKAVPGISDEELVRRAVRNAGNGGPLRERRFAVCEVFGVGKSFATSLCERFNLDPEGDVGPYDDDDTESEP